MTTSKRYAGLITKNRACELHELWHYAPIGRRAAAAGIETKLRDGWTGHNRDTDAPKNNRY
jgi:hypothetical protein